MRLKQQLTLIILITILTLTGPVQAVTASQLADHDDSNTTTKIRLPNEGRSDLQELIQRVDANVGNDSSQDSETPEPSEPAEETPVEEQSASEQPNPTSQSQTAEPRPRPRATAVNGTSYWIFEENTGQLTLGAGTLAERIDTNIAADGVAATAVKSILFDDDGAGNCVVAPPSVSRLFANLGQLSELINLNNFDTSNVTNMSYWFSNTKGLTNPDLSGFNTSKVTNMSYMFYGSGVTSLDLSAWDVNKVTSFNQMFSGADEITTLNLSNWGDGRTATTVSMAEMFYDTSALTTLTLTNFKTTNVTTMTNMFKGTSALTNINLANFETTNVTDMSYMFWNSGITNLDLSDWNVNKVTTFRNMFNTARSLTTLNLSTWGDGRTATTVNMQYMFYGTNALTNLTLTNFKTTNVTNMSNMFTNCGITNLDLSDWDVKKVTSFLGMFSYAQSLTTLNLSAWGDGRTATTVNMSAMFAGTSALTNLTLTNFKTTNVTDMGNMFTNCGIISLDLHDWDVNKVTNFSGMFNGETTNLRTLDLSGWHTTSGTSFNNMFNNNTNLWKITLGEGITFTTDPSFTSAPAIGTTIVDGGQLYKTTAASWQAVSTGTDHHPMGNMVTTTQMYADRSEPVTYVWAQAPTFNIMSTLTFGTLGASDFFNGNSPTATNMATGAINLINLESNMTYTVIVEQTSDWTADGQSATIGKSDLKVRYGNNDLSMGASDFWSGTSSTSQKAILFNHNASKNFNIGLNPNTVINSDLLGKQLESELTWTLSETP